MFFIKILFLVVNSNSAELFNGIMVGLRTHQRFLCTWDTNTHGFSRQLGGCGCFIASLTSPSVVQAKADILNFEQF